MTENLTKLVRLFTRWAGMVRGLAPVKLPHGRTEFDAFFAKLTRTYGLPDNSSYQHAVATMVMNLAPTTAYKAPAYFALSIKKAMANETAYAVIQEIRDADRKKAQEEALKKQAEATAQQNGVALGDGSSV